MKQLPNIINYLTILTDIIIINELLKYKNVVGQTFLLNLQFKKEQKMTVLIIITCLLSAGVVTQYVMFNKRKKRFFNKTAETEQTIRQRNTEINNLKKNIDDIEKENKELQSKLDCAEQRLTNSKFKTVEIIKNVSAVKKAMQPRLNLLKEYFNEFMILDMPADTVGGDFYKFSFQNNCVLIACGNCGLTGGIGLTKGILNNVFLSQIVENNDLTQISAGDVLDMVRTMHIKLGEQNSQYRQNDDLPVNFSVCIYDKLNRALSFSSAYGSMCLIRKSYPGTGRKEVDVHEFFGEKMNFAVSYGRRKNYDCQTFELEKDDFIIMKTDGFVNQKGGRQNQRFGDAYFRQMLMKHHNEAIEKRKLSFKEEFFTWKGNNKANDVLIIGLAPKVKSLYGKKRIEEESDLTVLNDIVTNNNQDNDQ